MESPHDLSAWRATAEWIIGAVMLIVVGVPFALVIGLLHTVFTILVNTGLILWHPDEVRAVPHDLREMFVRAFR